jgi:hypothetical protein
MSGIWPYRISDIKSGIRPDTELSSFFFSQDKSAAEVAQTCTGTTLTEKVNIVQKKRGMFLLSVVVVQTCVVDPNSFFSDSDKQIFCRILIRFRIRFQIRILILIFFSLIDPTVY